MTISLQHYLDCPTIRVKGCELISGLLVRMKGTVYRLTHTPDVSRCLDETTGRTALVYWFSATAHGTKQHARLSFYGSQSYEVVNEPNFLPNPDTLRRLADQIEAAR